MSDFTIEVDGIYVLRDGTVVGPISAAPKESEYAWTCDFLSWYSSGQFDDDFVKSEKDIVAEYNPPPRTQGKVSGFDEIQKAAHYNVHPSGVECIQVVEHMTFNIGNAMKYLWRCDHKDATLKDMQKAIYYIEREIKRRGLK